MPNADAAPRAILVLAGPIVDARVVAKVVVDLRRKKILFEKLNLKKF